MVDETPFRRWLEPFCESCKPLVLEEEREKEAKRIVEEQARQRSEREKRLLEKRMVALGGPGPYLHYTFETYDANMNDTHDWLNYIRNFPLDAKNLFVYGPAGSGKTRLCTAKVRSMWDKVPPANVLCLTARQFIARIKHSGLGRARNTFERQDIMREFAEIDVVFIDEIHEIDDKKGDVVFLKELIDTRERMNRFGLIYVANVNLENISQLMSFPFADRMDGPGWEVFRIPEETVSARGILKRRGKKA